MPRRQPHLFDRLCSVRELERAWGDVLAHYPKGRVPTELREFDRKRGANLQHLAEELHDRAFLPSPAALILIPKPNHPDERRPITLIRPEDRIVLTALNRLLHPLFEPQFLDHSYAYRMGRSARDAIERVTRCLRNGLVHTASGDIDDFFSNVDRNQLLRHIAKRVYERPVLDLLETFLHIGAVREFEWTDSGRGIAQGSPLSPLLSNVALDDFDHFIDHFPAEWIRYADNFVLMGNDAAVVEDCFGRAEAFLREHDGLGLNADSRRTASEADGFEFLGFWFRNGHRTISAAKLDQKRRSIAEALRRHAGKLGALVEDLSETVTGWRAYYGLSPDTRDQLLSLEQHIADLLTPWLQQLRSSEAGKPRSAADWKADLVRLELPATMDPRRKLKWVELVVARSRPRKEAGAHGLSPAARRAIEQRKKEHRRLKEDRQEVLIVKPGTYLGRTGERLLIRRQGKREEEIPLSLVRNITMLTRAMSISGDLMSEAAARGIQIVIAGADGRPLVRVGPPEVAEHRLSLAQSSMASSAAGLEVARIIVAGKIRNQENLLRYFLKYPERRTGGDFLSVASRSLQEMAGIREDVLSRAFGVDLELERNRLFASEGQAASSYWSAVRCLLWWKPGFEGRVRRGAADVVNGMLNYGYGILYSRLLSVLVRSGLNVYIGFLHKPQPGKAGLLYDFIEEFRTAAVDRAVFALLNLGSGVESGGDGLSVDTRHEIARKVIRRLQADTRYHGETMALERVMELQAQRMVRQIEGKEEYETYVLPW